MYKIKPRRRKLRVNNPAAFGILCAMIVVLIIGGIYALAVGVVAPGVQTLKELYATPSPEPTAPPATSKPTSTPAPTDTPEPTLEPGTTPTPTPTPENTVAGKLSGKVIGIDPARGYTSKVFGVSTGVYANRLNFAIAQLVKAGLEAEGATVILTYTDVKQSPDDTARAKALNGADVDIALRIECNSVSAADTRGAQMWIPSAHENQTQCEKFAKTMLSAYTKATDLPIRLYNNASIRKLDDLDIFNKTVSPIASIILGHISNTAEDKLLNDADFQKKMAKGIVDGFLAYFG